ncbi:unnamed protein product [Schistosoma mattheei]|uniref:Uncharacterized protein n=1 Tax=Schistosoma mattheei TaxID=31246 RepID=A0A3P8F023_9TREM|nr:unnamed protein product [Schistosoma mattheei]
MSILLKQLLQKCSNFLTIPVKNDCIYYFLSFLRGNCMYMVQTTLHMITNRHLILCNFSVVVVTKKGLLYGKES